MFSFTKEDNGKTLQCIVDPVHGDSVTTEEIVNVECIYNFYNYIISKFVYSRCRGSEKVSIMEMSYAALFMSYCY